MRRLTSARAAAMAGMALGLATLGGGTAPAAADYAAISANYNARTNYVLRCSGCHGVDGTGATTGGVPDLAGFVGAFAGDDDGRTYVVKVPGVRNANLNPRRTAEVLNYVMETFGGGSIKPGTAPFTEDEIVERLKIPVTDVVALRRQVAARLKDEGIVLAEYPWP